jgi:TPR repeat protein
MQASFKAGNVEAAYQLGSAYQYGRGVWKNQKEAVRWYRLGARRGDDQAALALADSYLAGEGTERNEEKAVYWYLKVGASESVSARPARTRLLTMTRNYALGENGVKQDPARARELFTLLLKMEQEGQARTVTPQFAER